MATETRTHVQFLYPGSFFPEESGSYRIASPAVADVLTVQPDRDWFAAEVTTQAWMLWTAEGQPDRWLSTKPVTKFRILVGEVLTTTGVEALPGDHRILLSNMRGNGWDRVCRTRRGNFQPVENGDVVLTEDEAVS